MIGFFNDYNNLVGTCTQSAGCAEEDIDEQFNAGRAHILGAEAVIGTATGLGFGYALNVRCHVPGPRLDLSLTLIRAFLSGVQSKEVTSCRMYLNYQASVEGCSRQNNRRDRDHHSCRRDAWMLQVKEADAAELVESNTVVDLAAFYRPTPKGRLYLTIDNLLAQDYMVSRRPFGAMARQTLSVKFGLPALSRPGRSSSSTALRDP